MGLGGLLYNVKPGHFDVGGFAVAPRKVMLACKQTFLSCSLEATQNPRLFPCDNLPGGAFLARVAGGTGFHYANRKQLAGAFVLPDGYSVVTATGQPGAGGVMNDIDEFEEFHGLRC